MTTNTNERTPDHATLIDPEYLRDLRRDVEMDGEAWYRCGYCGAWNAQDTGRCSACDRSAEPTEAAEVESCCCGDPGCPHCDGKCDAPATVHLRRIDMDDEPMPFCSGCADDALACGVFAVVDADADADAEGGEL
jgi:hypothetical protein